MFQISELENRLIKLSLDEDLGNLGDIGTNAIFSATDNSEGKFIAKDDGIIAGLNIARSVYRLLLNEYLICGEDFKEEQVVFTANYKDGDFVQKGDVLAVVEGKTRALLTGERVILNIMQRMSAIATRTDKVVKLLDEIGIKILDTRKTAPGMRVFDKKAVKIGGGVNHRIGLYDMVMIKDNHIDFAGSITNAVNKVRLTKNDVKIEVETRNKNEVLGAVQNNVDVIMFDNMTPEMIIELKKFIPDHIKTEVSGGITPENITQYKYTGVDYISMGFLTHSVTAFDISFISSTK